MSILASFTIAEVGMFTLLGRYSPTSGALRFAIVNPDLNLAEFYISLDAAKAAFTKFTQGATA